jgi:SAM-dependent methyltransferase
MSAEARRGYIRGYFSAISQAPDWIIPTDALDGGSGGHVYNKYYRMGSYELAHLAVVLGGLTPDGSVLDVGCGTGKLAAPLIYFMSPQGRYDGFDVAPDSIAWCAEAFAAYPNLHFRHVEVESWAYGREGRTRAEEATFPYPDESFDVIVAASVLTHMTRAAGVRHFREMRRVLKPGGTAVVTLFVLFDDEAPAAGGVTPLLGVGEGQYAFRFTGREPGFYSHCDEEGRPKSHYAQARLSDVGDPVAYSERWLLKQLSRNWSNVHIVEGRWRRGGHAPPFQDVVVLTK